MMIDTHCHLDDAQFTDDLDAVIARATDAGVGTIITAGADVTSSRAAIELAEQHQNIYAVVGIHPEHAGSFDSESLATIRNLARHRKAVGIGEIGLDFYWSQNPPCEIQQVALNAQIDLAEELGRPVVIHDRDAHAELMQILERRNGKLHGILHCFSGDLDMARRAINLGFYISIAGNVTFKNAQQLKEIARGLPLERIVVETDSPYLSPLRGLRNEPANVTRVVAKIAELKNIATSVVELATTRNSQMLFGLSE